MDDTPKIIVDSDWKQQAQAEKERLAQAEKAKGEQAGSAQDPNRPVDFIDLVQSLASQALLYMGAIPDPESGRAVLAPEMARMSIDMLGVLETKTKGNLTEEESSALTDVLRELRFQFVEVSRAIAKAIQEGKIKPQGGVQPMGAPDPTRGPIKG